MKVETVVPREQARRDVEEAIEHYLREDAETAALAFVDALEKAYRHIGRHPATGSPRWAHELHLPGLRSWPLTRHPYLVFYVEHSDHVDVWRVLTGYDSVEVDARIAYADGASDPDAFGMCAVGPRSIMRLTCASRSCR